MIINAQYAVGRVVPQEVPKGRVLAHNQIEHTARTPNGVRSFRWWTWPKGEVPHYMPGSNPFLDDFAKKYNLPLEVTLGGADSMYPEAARKLIRAANEGMAKK